MMPVLLTYPATLFFHYQRYATADLQNPPVMVAIIVVIVLTTSHVALPVFLLGNWRKHLRKTKGMNNRGTELFISLFWFGGFFLLGLLMQGALAGMIQFIMSPRSTWKWLLVQYGSTSFAAILCISVVGAPSRLGPILALCFLGLFHIALLTFIEMHGRKLWIDDGPVGKPFYKEIPRLLRVLLR
jgi:hypothetical protein